MESNANDILKSINDLRKDKETENLKDLKDLERETKHNKYQNKSGLISEILISIFFAIITLLMLGITTVYQQGWDWSMYKSETFWSYYLTTQLSSWFTRVWILLIRTKSIKRTNEKYIHFTTEIKKHATVDRETPFINKMVEIDKYNRKKIAWKNKQKIKLVKLSKKYKITNVVEHLNSLENTQYKAVGTFELKSDIIYRSTIFNALKSVKSKIDKWERKKVKINNKINDIFRTMSDTYIINNFDNLKVKYNEVSRTILLSGVNPIGNQNLQGYSYQKKTVSEFLKDTMPMFIFMSALTFLIIPLLMDNSVSKDVSVWSKFILSVFTVSGSGLMTLINVPSLFERTHLRVIEEREDTLKTYAINSKNVVDKIEN